MWREYIKNQVQDYELTVIEQNNESDVIKGTDISLTYQENNDIEDALSAQNPLLWPMAFFEKSSASVTIDVAMTRMRWQKRSSPSRQLLRSRLSRFQRTRNSMEILSW